MIEEHSKLFPFSGAHRWVHCHGSIGLCFDEPDVETESAREGTAAHWVAEQMLQAYKQRTDSNGIPTGEALVGSQAPNGVIVTDEMFDAALTYYNKITKVVGTDVKRKSRLMLEQRVRAPGLDEEAWGTADAIFYDATTNTLYIWDFKYGHASVIAFENYQLLGYAEGAVHELQLASYCPRLDLNIVQPRCFDGAGPLRKWVVSYNDIRGYLNHMKHAIDTHKANNALVTSGSWCKDCKAGYKCPAIRQSTALAIDWSNLPIPQGMSNESLAYQLDVVEMAIKRLESRKVALDAEAERRVKEGQFVPGRRMEDTVSRDQWNKTPKEIKILGEMFHMDFLNEPKPKTPGQVKEMLRKKGIDASVISGYYSKSKTGIRMVPDDGSKARNIFSQEKI